METLSGSLISYVQPVDWLSEGLGLVGFDFKMTGCLHVYWLPEWFIDYGGKKAGKGRVVTGTEKDTY